MYLNALPYSFLSVKRIEKREERAVSRDDPTMRPSDEGLSKVSEHK